MAMKYLQPAEHHPRNLTPVLSNPRSSAWGAGHEGHPVKWEGNGACRPWKFRLISWHRGSDPSVPWPSPGLAPLANQVQRRPSLPAAASLLHHIPSLSDAYKGWFPHLSGTGPVGADGCGASLGGCGPPGRCGQALRTSEGLSRDGDGKTLYLRVFERKNSCQA